MSKTPDGSKNVEQALKILTDSMSTYQEIYQTVTVQKPFQALDYDELSKRLSENTVTASKLRDKLKEKKIEIEYVDEILASLIDASQALARMVDGLGDKANNRGKYGWFTYRSDGKAHERKRKVFLGYVQAFSGTIETVPDEPRVITAKAFVLDPLSNNVLEEEIELFEDQYNESKEADGYVYVLRSYKEGKPESVLIKKELWESIKPTFVVSEEQRQADVDDIMSKILKDK